MDESKKRLDALRHLTPEQLSALREAFRGDDIEFVYASNAIEGSRLTLRETQVVIEQGVTIGGKPLQDHIDAIHGAKAVSLMNDIVARGEPLDADRILALHTAVLGPGDSRAGRIRTSAVRITGSRHTPPAWPEVSDAFDRLLAAYLIARESVHPVLATADFHHRFTNIHPFAEGNGRTARLVTGAQLMQSGYPPLVIAPEDRLQYYEALSDADAGRPEPFRSFVFDRVERALERYVAVLERYDSSDRS